MTREEAIEELRCFIGQLTEGCQEAIKVLVPELKESEDEKMLRTIIGGFENWKSNGREIFNNTEVDDILAWLKKQKEQKPEVKFTGWVARDMNGEIWIYGAYPEKDSIKQMWVGSNSMPLDQRSFPDLKWGDEPVEVEITITRKPS